MLFYLVILGVPKKKEFLLLVKGKGDYKSDLVRLHYKPTSQPLHTVPTLFVTLFLIKLI